MESLKQLQTHLVSVARMCSCRLREMLSFRYNVGSSLFEDIFSVVAAGAAVGKKNSDGGRRGARAAEAPWLEPRLHRLQHRRGRGARRCEEGERDRNDCLIRTREQDSPNSEGFLV